MDDIWKILEGFHLDDDDKTDPKKTVIDNVLTSFCNSCQSDDVVLDEGNYMCKQCNCIISRYIDPNAE